MFTMFLMVSFCGYICYNKSGTQLEKIKKELQRLFKEYDLEITAESSQKIESYLDVTLNLKDGTFKPNHKPGDQIQYIHTKSNYPQTLLNIYQPLQNLVYQTYAPLKQYSKN